MDTIAALVSLALGQSFDLTQRRSRHAVLHVLASPLETDGRLVGFEQVEAVRALPGVARVELFAEPGDLVRPFTRSRNKLGYVLVVGDTPEQAEDSLREALARLRVVVAAEEDEHVPA